MHAVLLSYFVRFFVFAKTLAKFFAEAHFESIKFSAKIMRLLAALAPEHYKKLSESGQLLLSCVRFSSVSSNTKDVQFKIFFCYL
jgi:hypothetical protein